MTRWRNEQILVQYSSIILIMIIKGASKTNTVYKKMSAMARENSLAY